MYATTSFTCKETSCRCGATSYRCGAQVLYKLTEVFLSATARHTYWCTTFDCVILATTIILASKMDSKEKETKCQKNSEVDYSFPISEYAKQLDLPVRDRYLQKIAAI